MYSTLWIWKYFLSHFLIWSLLWLNIIIIINLVELPKGLEIWSFSQVPVCENVPELEFWLKICMFLPVVWLLNHPASFYCSIPIPWDQREQILSPPGHAISGCLGRAVAGEGEYENQRRHTKFSGRNYDFAKILHGIILKSSLKKSHFTEKETKIQKDTHLWLHSYPECEGRPVGQQVSISPILDTRFPLVPWFLENYLKGKSY